MLVRTCIAMLTATSMVMLLLPVNVACRSSVPPKDQRELATTYRYQAFGDRQPGYHGTTDAADLKQTSRPADLHTEQVKRDVRRIGLASKITVFLKNGDDLHGAVTVMEDQNFQVAEVDLHQIITVEYRDVKKVRSGYGGKNLFTGRHTSQPRWVAPAITIGLLGLLIVPLFFMKD